MDGSTVFPSCASVHLTLYTLPWAYTRVQILNGISIGSTVFAQLTAKGDYTFTTGRFSPLKLPLSVGSGHRSHDI